MDNFDEYNESYYSYIRRKQILQYRQEFDDEISQQKWFESDASLQDVNNDDKYVDAQSEMKASSGFETEYDHHDIYSGYGENMNANDVENESVLSNGFSFSDTAQFFQHTEKGYAYDEDTNNDVIRENATVEFNFHSKDNFQGAHYDEYSEYGEKKSNNYMGNAFVHNDASNIFDRKQKLHHSQHDHEIDKRCQATSLDQQHANGYRDNNIFPIVQTKDANLGGSSRHEEHINKNTDKKTCVEKDTNLGLAKSKCAKNELAKETGIRTPKKSHPIEQIDERICLSSEHEKQKKVSDDILKQYLNSGYNVGWQLKDTLTLERSEVEKGNLSNYSILVNESFPTCNLKVKNVQTNSNQKKKSIAPIKWFKAECSDKACKIQVKLLIFSMDYEKVRSYILSKGEAAMYHQPFNKLEGYQRYVVAKELEGGVKATKKHFEMLGNIIPGSDIGERRPLVPSKTALRKCAYELRKRSKICSDPMDALTTLQKTFVEMDVHSKAMKGLVQSCDVARKFFVLHTENQMKVSSTQKVFHLDSTGELGNADTNVLLFALCVKAENLHPVAVSTCLTASQKASDVTQFLQQKKRDYKQVNGSEFKPEVIVTDFSFPLIKGTLEAFSQGELDKYLDDHYDGEKKSLNLKLCHVHMGRQIQRKAKTLCGGNKKVQNTFVTMFVRMMNAKDNTDRDQLFKQICLLSKSRKLLPEVEAIMRDSEPVHLNIDTDLHPEPEREKSSKSTYRARTKYGMYYNALAEETVANIDDANCVDENDAFDNPHYCPKFIDYLLTYVMPFTPFWSATNSGLYSNSPVENLFGAYKRYHFKTKTDVASFVEEINGVFLSRSMPYLVSDKACPEKKKQGKKNSERRTRTMEQISKERRPIYLAEVTVVL